MKAILIESAGRFLHEIDIKDGDDIIEYIGEPCNSFELVLRIELDDGELQIYADENARLNKRGEVEGGFHWVGDALQIIGNAVLMRVDKEGEWVDVESSAKDLYGDIVWLAPNQLDLSPGKFIVMSKEEFEKRKPKPT